MKHLIFALAIFLTAAGVHAQNRTTFKQHRKPYVIMKNSWAL